MSSLEQSKNPIDVKDDETGDTNQLEDQSYTNTKTSIAYTTAKALLASGEFETALETIETALGSVLSSLPPSENNELHPSLAPLYYLYGTTLLYSVEESGDAMMQPSTDPNANQSTAATGVSKIEDQAEDIQISWENLESARTVLANLTISHPDSSMYALDLAQVHQRLGDLQKGNGNYAEAIQDYKSALNKRMEILGRFDRSVADCHYSLGMTFMLLASAVDASKDTQNKGLKSGDGSDALASEMLLGGKEELRRKSIMHYVSCGCIFAGLIGSMCGKLDVETSKIDVDGEDLSETWWEEEPKKKRAKTSSEEKNEKEDKEEIKFSKALKTLRERVKEMKSTDSSNGGLVFDFKEVLDEIQETIDSSEESLEAVNDLSKMKAEREAEAEAEDETALRAGIAASKGGVASAAASGTTTIGFGGSAASAGVAASANLGSTIIGFGNNVNTETKYDTKPVQMMIKKKKRPTQVEDPSKRAKSE